MSEPRLQLARGRLVQPRVHRIPELGEMLSKLGVAPSDMDAVRAAAEADAPRPQMLSFVHSETERVLPSSAKRVASVQRRGASPLCFAPVA